MRIRLAHIDDLPVIVEISNRSAAISAANFATTPEPLEAWEWEWCSTYEMYPWYVAVERDEILGFSKAGPWKKRGAYDWTAEVTVYVNPVHHRRGVGRALYEQLINTMRAQGYHTLVAGITAPNPASERLHESFGFERYGCFERIGWKFERWHTVEHWQLFLQPEDQRPLKILKVKEVTGRHAGGAAQGS